MKYYCINLDKRPDRWETFKKDFKELNLGCEPTRISGVDFNLDPLFISDFKHDTTLQTIVNAAGCAAAHYNAITTAIKDGSDTFTIFEDDAFFYDYSKDLITKSLHYLKDKDWHILYWGCEPNKDSDPNPIRETEVDFIVRVLSANLTHAMTYNRDFAINLVKNFPQNMDVGEWIAWIKEHQPLDKYLHSHLIKGKCYVPHKICACQYNGYSDIDCLHNDRKDVIEKAFKENTLI